MKKLDVAILNGLKSFDRRKVIKQSIVGMILMLLASLMSARGSTLTVKTWTKAKFTVELDYQVYSNEFEFMFHDLEPGKHRIKIYRERVNVHSGRRYKRVLFNGFIDIPRHSHTTAKVQPNYKLEISNKRMKPKPVKPVVVPVEPCLDLEEVEVVPVEPEPACTHPHHHDEIEEIEEEIIFDEVDIIMEETQFDQLIQVLEDEWLDSKRMSMAKAAIKNNLVNAEQVLELLDVFFFESSKLEMAKAAYPQTVDPENYYLVYQAFNYQSSINELEIFIEEHEH